MVHEITNKSYVCDVCERVFSNESGAQRCEYDHKLSNCKTKEDHIWSYTYKDGPYAIVLSRTCSSCTMTEEIVLDYKVGHSEFLKDLMERTTKC